MWCATGARQRQERDENRFAYCMRLLTELQNQKVEPSEKARAKDPKAKGKTLTPIQQVFHVCKLVKKGASAEQIP